MIFTKPFVPSVVYNPLSKIYKFMWPFTTKENNEIRELAKSFAQKEIAPIAQQLDDEEIFSVELTQKMGKAGLFGIDIPKKYGGQGLTTLSYIIAVEEIARIDASQAATMAAHNSLGIAPIYKFGSEAQRRAILPKLCNGENLWAFGLTEENAGCDAKGAETTAQLTNNQWVINGTKRYITNGGNKLTAGITLLAITGEKDDKKEYSTILAPYTEKGITTENMKGKMMWRASDTSKVEINNVSVPQENLLGARGKGMSQMLETLDSGRLSIAAMGLGLAKGAFNEAKNYSKERKQFGAPLASFQSISFSLADMALKIELAENMLYKACWLKDNGQPFGKEAAMAKLYCSDVAFEVADGAMQIFAGAGLFKNRLIERFYRDQRILRIGEGTSEVLKMVIFRSL